MAESCLDFKVPVAERQERGLGSGNLGSDLLGDVGKLISISLGPRFTHFQMKVRVKSYQEDPDMYKEFLPFA